VALAPGVSVGAAVAVAAGVAVGEDVAEGVGEAVGTTVGEAVGAGLGLGVVVNSPPCPRKTALAKMRAKTTMTAATKILVTGSSTVRTSSRSGSGRVGLGSALVVTRRV
jgi:hypothetical protein